MGISESAVCPSRLGLGLGLGMNCKGASHHGVRHPVRSMGCQSPLSAHSRTVRVRVTMGPGEEAKYTMGPGEFEKVGAFRTKSPRGVV